MASHGEAPTASGHSTRAIAHVGRILALSSLSIFAYHAVVDLAAYTSLHRIDQETLRSAVLVSAAAIGLDLLLADRLPTLVRPIVTVTGLALAYLCSALHWEIYSTALLVMVIFLCAPRVARRVLATTLQGNLSADVVALAALGGSMLLSEYFAAALIVLMLGGGAALEEAAQAQAGVDLEDLRRRVPSIAHRVRRGTETDEVPVHELQIGDVLLVRAGETLPADGTLERGHALVDYASLTGEPLPVEKKEGDVLLSGAINLRAPILLRISHSPALSSFAQLTRELEAALQRPGRFQKQADLYGGLFTPVALAVASVALLCNRTYRPWHAALAVLNAATPCPLLIAVPVATLAGLGVAARRGLLVRGGVALEAASATNTLVLDKTGTLTEGKLTLRTIQPMPSCALPSSTLLYYAAAVEYGSSHLLARAICNAATAVRSKSDPTALHADEIEDLDGQGVAAFVTSSVARPTLVSPRTGRPVSPRRLATERRKRNSSAAQSGVRVRVAVGSMRCMIHLGVAPPADGWPSAETDTLAVYLALNNVLAARLLFHDTLRAEAVSVVQELRTLGIKRVVLLSGDAEPAVSAAAKSVGADEWHASCMPRDKAAHVERLACEGAVVQFVGDGVNDALALACATLGVALSADTETDSMGTAANIAAAAAGVVVLKGSLHGLLSLRRLAQSVRCTALESAVGGLGASVLVMCAALMGHVSPAMGAVSQELVDLIAIGNALRVLRA